MALSLARCLLSARMMVGVSYHTLWILSGRFMARDGMSKRNFPSGTWNHHPGNGNVDGLIKRAPIAPGSMNYKQHWIRSNLFLFETQAGRRWQRTNGLNLSWLR